MQVVDNFLNETRSGANQGKAAAARPWVIQARIAGPADLVVYEYGARLDANCRAAATEQIDKARPLQHADRQYPDCSRPNECLGARACRTARAGIA